MLKAYNQPGLYCFGTVILREPIQPESLLFAMVFLFILALRKMIIFSQDGLFIRMGCICHQVLMGILILWVEFRTGWKTRLI